MYKALFYGLLFFLGDIPWSSPSLGSCLSSVQSLSRVRLFATPWTAAHQASLSITNSWSLLRLMLIESMMPCNHLILCHPFSRLQSFAESGSFQMSQFFKSGGQSIGGSASASVLPMNIQDWFLLGLTGLTSLQSKGLSRVFSNRTVQKHQFFSIQLSLIVQLSHPYMTTGKTIASTRWTFVSKVTSSNSNVFCNPSKFMFLNVWAFLVFSKVF